MALTNKEMQKRWKDKNRDKVREYNRTQYKKNWAVPEFRAMKNKQATENVNRLKDIVYSHYGKKCNCCGETNLLFLTIDHIENDGYKEKTKSGNRRSGTPMYTLIVKNGFPESYQILCMNCNLGKARNGGVCPHKSYGVDN